MRERSRVEYKKERESGEFPKMWKKVKIRRESGTKEKKRRLKGNKERLVTCLPTAKCALLRVARLVQVRCMHPNEAQCLFIHTVRGYTHCESETWIVIRERKRYYLGLFRWWDISL